MKKDEVMQFSEEYNNKSRKIGTILFIIFQLMLLFTLPILEKINNQFLLDNANFVCYIILFIIFIIIYGKTIINSIKKLMLKILTI